MELLVKEKFFPENSNLPNLVDIQHWHENDCVFLTMFILCLTFLLKFFVYSRVGILDYPWCNNPYCAYQELGQGDFYSFDQKFIYYLPTKNVTARQTILTSILSIAFVTEWTSIGL